MRIMQSDAHIYAVICTSMRTWKSHAHFMHINITNICHLMRIDFYRGTSWLQRHSSLLIGFPEQRSMHLAIAGKQRQIKTRSRNKTALEWRNGRLLAEAVSSVRSGFPLWPPLPALPSAALAADLVKRLSRQLYHYIIWKGLKLAFDRFQSKQCPPVAFSLIQNFGERRVQPWNIICWIGLIGSYFLTNHIFTYRVLFLGKLHIGIFIKKSNTSQA